MALIEAFSIDLRSITGTEVGISWTLSGDAPVNAGVADLVAAEGLVLFRTLSLTDTLLSQGSRTSWLWSPDESTTDRLRAILTAAAAPWQPAYRRGEEQRLVTDIGIGSDAFEAASVLAEHGVRFGWHPTQHMLNRFGWWGSDLPGMPAPSPVAG